MEKKRRLVLNNQFIIMKKKLVICASASFENKIIEWKNKISDDFIVIKYPVKIKGNFLDNYKIEFSDHYKSILESDAIIALNFEKNEIPGYIGAGVFAELAFAIGLNQTQNKKIDVYYLNNFPEKAFPYSDELKLWQGLGWIKLFPTPTK